MAKKSAPHLVLHDARPNLLVIASDPAQTATDLVRILAPTHTFLRREDHLVRLVKGKAGRLPVVRAATIAAVVKAAHQICRPVKRSANGLEPIALPERVAAIVLESADDFAPFNGITSGLKFTADGTVSTRSGYDPETGLVHVNVPSITAPERPTKTDAEEALKRVRHRFRTFAAADATMVHDPALGVDVIDLQQDPGQDESAMLTGLLTAVLSSSL
jgi:hypothetical protein